MEIHDVLKLIIVLSFSGLLISFLIFRKTKQEKPNPFKGTWKSWVNLLARYSTYICLTVLITFAFAFVLKYILQLI